MIDNRDEYIRWLRAMIDHKNRKPSPPPKPAPEPKPAFRPISGDAVDELMAAKLREHDCEVPCTRLGGGFYLFGTRKIYCKIMNGKLVVRVGGGYMSIDEFLLTNTSHELCRIQFTMEKEDITEYEELNVYQKWVVKAGIKGTIRIKTEVKKEKHRNFVKEKRNTFAF